MTPLSDRQKRAAEAHPVSADEIRSLPFPAGCLGFYRATLYGTSLTDEVRFNARKISADYQVLCEHACLAAVWWFRTRAEACGWNGTYALNETVHILRDRKESECSEDEQKRLKELDAVYDAMSDEEYHWLSCADAWEGILRRVQR
jgi:hypothetical protein